MASAAADELTLNALYADYLPQEIPAAAAAAPRRKKKLTPAEKRQRRLKEEQDFKILEMRDLMRRELEMSKKTARKYHERWENMCREVKLKQMRKELEDWEAKVNRVMKQKDEKIELILDEISTTKEIQEKHFSTQMQTMEYLMNIWKTFQEASRVLYEKEASEMLHDFYREADERSAIENSIKINCESVSHGTGLIMEQEMSSDYNIFLDKRDDRVNSEIEKRYCLRDAVVKKMKILHQQLQEFVDSLLSTPLDVQKYERINSLHERRRILHRESLKLNSTEAKSSRIYSDLQKLLSQEERVTQRKLDDLKLQHAYFVQMRKNIENEMKLNRQEVQEKLKISTSESFKVLQKYKNLLKFGELLLSLAATCRKYQTQSEKVLPWGGLPEPTKESDTDSEPFQLQVIDLKKHVDISETELLGHAQLMKNFWRRQAIVEAEIVLLEERKLQLKIEHNGYIDTIKRLSKSDNVEDLQESLSVKRASDSNID